MLERPALHAALPADKKYGCNFVTPKPHGPDGGDEWNCSFHDTVPYHNGYVITVDGLRVYVSGDTEDTPEMRALENIDIAFVCMNLPFTMDAEAAASGVSAFAPSYVYPYHYRGRDNGTQDPAAFAEMLAEGIEAKFGPWYG